MDDVRYLTTLIKAAEQAKGAGGEKARLAKGTEAWIQTINPQTDLDALRQETIRRILKIIK